MKMEKRWIFPVILSCLICMFVMVSYMSMGLISSLQPINSILSILSIHNQSLASLTQQQQQQHHPLPLRIPRFAYLVSGSKGDVDKLWRTLRALYHPLNQYIVHMDLESPAAERLELATKIEKDPLFSHVGNVYMITKANMVTYRGPTMVANTLHACAILLKKSQNWDWFINLSASDYPLVTQDGSFIFANFLHAYYIYVQHLLSL